MNPRLDRLIVRLLERLVPELRDLGSSLSAWPEVLADLVYGRQG